MLRSPGLVFGTSFVGVMNKYNFLNFYRGTVANFSLCEVPNRDPDFFSFCGSSYWDLGDRVRRCSNHWGPRIASCSWYLDLETLELKYCLCGECLYEEFRSKYDVVSFGFLDRSQSLRNDNTEGAQCLDSSGILRSPQSRRIHRI